MAEDDPELWNAINRLTAVLETAEMVHPLTTGFTLPSWIGGKKEPTTKIEDDLKSPKSKTYKEIDELLTKLTKQHDEMESGKDKVAKDMKEIMKNRLVTLKSVLKALKSQKDDLIKVHVAFEDCDSHANVIIESLRSIESWALVDQQTKQNV